MKAKLSLFLSMMLLLGVATPLFASLKDDCINFEDGDYVTCSGIPGYSAITIEGWINHSNIAESTQRYFTMMDETAVIRKNGSDISFYFKPSSGSITHVNYAYSFIVGQWVHVAGTYDGTTAKLYVDGIMVSSVTTTGGVYTNSGEFRIGNDGESMRGQIDDVRLWNVARTQEEIESNLNHELSGTETGLVSYWKLNDGSGTVALDAKGTSHGTLVGMTDANWIVFDPTPDWLWAMQGGGNSEDYVRDIAKDSNGNSYVVGSFYGIASFGSIMVSSSDLSAPVGYQYSTNIYVAKLDAEGNYLWASEAGGFLFDSGYCIATDTDGNAYITGVFNGTADFGTTSLTSNGDSDIFIAKLSPGGNWLWAKKAGGSGADIGTSIATDTDNNVYVTGAFTGTATFGTESLTSSGGEDAFIAKLNSSGTWQWAKKGGGTDNDRGYAVAVYSIIDICVTGSFAGTATFGTSQLTSSGSNDIFIVHLKGSGIWGGLNRCGGSGDDYSYGIDSDSSGYFYVTGSFQGTASFGTYSLTSNGSDDIFVTKLDRYANFLWVAQAGGTGNDSGYGIASGRNGNCYVTGYFCDTATFGATQLSSIGNSDIYVAKLGSTGNWTWAKRAGSTAGDFGYGITSDSDGYVYATGTFQGTVSFGSTALTSSGSSDVYIAMIDHDLAVLEISESEIAFGTGYIGDTSSHTLWLKNRGYESILVTSFAFGQTGSPFAVSGHVPWVITPGDSISFLVCFAPVAIGAVSDVLSIYSEADNLPTAIISLSGTGAYVAQPFPPMNVAMVMDGTNAVISWDAVTETETHEPIVPDYYLVFFNGSGDIDAPFYYHGATTGLQYTQYLVGLHSPHMFYHVIAYVSGHRSRPDLTEMGLRQGMSKAEVLKLLR